MSGVHCLKDFLCSAYLLGSFDGQIYTYGSVLKSKFVHQRIQEDGHYRENPSNHELLKLRGVDHQVLLKMFRGQITLYYTLICMVVAQCNAIVLLSQAHLINSK